MTIDKFLFILALICFIVAFLSPFFGRPDGSGGTWSRINLIALGLAFWVLTNII